METTVYVTVKKTGTERESICEDVFLSSPLVLNDIVQMLGSVMEEFGLQDEFYVETEIFYENNKEKKSYEGGRVPIGETITPDENNKERRCRECNTLLEPEYGDTEGVLWRCNHCGRSRWTRWSEESVYREQDLNAVYGKMATKSKEMNNNE